LGALPAVGASATQNFTGEALARISDAEGSVYKNFQGKARVFCGGWEFGEFAEREFSSKNRKGDALATGKGDPFGRGESHLGGSMNFYFRADFPCQANQSEILNDDGVHLGFTHPTKESFGFDEFRGKDQYIEREVATTTAGMKVIHDKGKIGFSEIFGSETGIERGESEVDGISTGGNGSLEALPIACRG
jgi:hypothetical protein